MRCVDSQNNRVDDNLCTAEKPRAEEKCHTTCEKSWFYSDWSSDVNKYSYWLYVISSGIIILAAMILGVTVCC